MIIQRQKSNDRYHDELPWTKEDNIYKHTVMRHRLNKQSQFPQKKHVIYYFSHFYIMFLTVFK